MKWYNLSDSVFSVEGFAVKDYENKKLYRLPENLMDISQGMPVLAQYSAGCKVRFKTNSKTITAKVKLSNGINPDSAVANKIPPILASGMDIYAASANSDYEFRWFAAAPNLLKDEYTADLHKFNDDMEDILINLPVFNGIRELELGFSDNSEVLPPRAYKTEKPILFYGSSITQGACASRPGCTYASILSRWLDAPAINLGFAGNAFGEKEIAEYIANIDMFAFIFDYDHNAPTPTHLEATHKQFYNIIRSKNRELPIIMLTRPMMKETDDSIQRLKIVKKTYSDAIAAGDKKVWFIDGNTLWAYFDKNEKMSATTDTCHPNDYGFISMAKTIYPVLKMLV